MNQDLANRIKQCPNLPSLPSVAVQVLELAQQTDVDITQIARIISKDPALSGKILRTVNSSFYGRSQHVSTISHALVILGLQSVKTLVLGFSLVGSLSSEKAKGFKHLTYWKRSIYAATAARHIAGRLKLVQQEEAFLASLLQDIGMLVLDRVLGPEYGQIHDSITTHSQLATAEQQALGTDHAEVGGLLAAEWNLPPLLTMPIACHHDPGKTSDPVLKKLAELVGLAGACADVFVDDAAAAQSLALVQKTFKDLYQINETVCNALMDEIGNTTREVASLFEIKLGSPAKFEDILKKANEALVALTLQTQQQMTTLQEQNSELLNKASTDPLTALANRGRFDEFFEGAFRSAAAAGHPIAIVMLDIDHFKRVNDKYGHQNGDLVLKGIGKLFASAARPTDLAARYGGEEMALVLPGTTRATAATIADAIRRAVSAKPFSCEQAKIKVTASLGVAALEPGVPMREPAHLLRAADLALYNAKSAGRDCVRVFSTKAPQVAKPAA